MRMMWRQLKKGEPTSMENQRSTVVDGVTGYLGELSTHTVSTASLTTVRKTA